MPKNGRLKRKKAAESSDEPPSDIPYYYKGVLPLCQVIEITAANFEQEVLKSEQPVMLDFWAVWCGPCRMLSPVIEEIAAENPDIKVGKVNVDNEMSLAERYSIMSIPTVMVFKNGKLVDTSVGVRPKRELLAMIEE